jgi:hypothetical protein
MSQFARHPAYLLIEDALDAIGQRWRLVLILRGFMLWIAGAAASSFAAGLAAHLAGHGRIAAVILGFWLAWLAGSLIVWIIRPLLLRPRNMAVARLIEQRVAGLHNGLTNSVLLAQAGDLRESPWLNEIFEEILASTRARPLAETVGGRDLKPPLLKLAAVVLPLFLLLLFPGVRSSLQQGWRQMFSPTVFVPKVGRVRIIEITPRQITLVVGQPLEINILADDPDKGLPAARLLFEKDRLARTELTPTQSAEGQLRYSYRVEHVEEPLRFYAEVGGTQSEWCEVKLVKQVKLQELSLNITPPAYTRKPAQSLALKPQDIEKSALLVLEGSRVEISPLCDVPVKSALLQVNQDGPIPMMAAQEGRRFTQTVTLMQPAELAALLTENGQVIAKVPDPALKIGCTKDAPPTIEMKWPTQDLAVSPKQELKIAAILKDDYGVSGVRVLMSSGPDQPMNLVHEKPFAEGTTSAEFSYVLTVPENLRVHGQSLKVQVEATDNRNLAGVVGVGPGAPTSAKETGPQTTTSHIYEIKFRDPEQIAKEKKEETDKLRALLLEMLKKQRELHTMTVAWRPGGTAMPQVQRGQKELRGIMQGTAESFQFSPDDRLVQKTLLVLSQNQAKDAVELAGAIVTEPVEAEQIKLDKDLQSRQRRIMDTLETLLSRLNVATPSTTQPTKNGGDLENDKEKYKQLDEALKKFIAEEKRILDATATLAKKPVDSFDNDDKKLLEELMQSQEKLDAFMQEKISDFSKLAEQDMANASLLKEMMEVYSEVTMAKDALKKKAVELAVPLEESGLELAKEIESNLEKWLMNEPDRIKWNMEDPVGKNDIPMAELPKELEDMIGELMEQQEDLFEEMEDTAANWADSLDKGAGWDAADGPIANMSAKGVTGNQLPNNNEMKGRSGEGRSGKSQGEFVEETATGKGGRNTPTRLDPTPFQQGQVKDQSKDPVGGATGGGKISGQGGQGLEGPVPPKDMRDKMERLAGKQAELRNKAERLNLDKKLGRYDNFKLMEAAALMRRVESDIHANRYNNALRRRDVMLDDLDTSHTLLSGQIHLQKDTSPAMSDKMEEQINDVVNGQLPAEWSETLKEFYKRLGRE